MFWYVKFLIIKKFLIYQNFKGCIQLNCPIGNAGLTGPPGEDGLPGESGLPGKSGEDGYDIELEPENDLPCIICPGGPPGQR